MAQALLLTIAASGAAFFVRRWKADPLALAFLASLIYFAPGPTGVARFSYGEGRGGYHMAFEPLALVVMAIVLGAIIVAAALLDRMPPVSLRSR